MSAVIDLLAAVRELPARVADRQSLALFPIGALASYSAFGLLGAGAVSLPVVGAVPGTALGVGGLAASGLAYARLGCGGAGDCGCGEDCSGDG